MNTFLKKISGLKKHLLTFLLTSNLILVSTGSAGVSLPSASSSPEATTSANLASPFPSASPTITIKPTPPKKTSGEKLKKIDPSGKFIEDEIVVRYKEGVSENEKASIALENESQVEKVLPYSGLKILNVDPAKREKVIERLKNNPKVDYVGPNFATGVSSIPIPDDPAYPSQWHLDKIRAPIAWSQHIGDPGVKVAVVDTGINYNLAEFGLAGSGGRVIKGRDAYNVDDDPMDDNGHGTQVAGVLGAKTDNGVDVAAVDWHAQIIAVKVLASNGSGGSGELTEGLKWLVDTNPAGLKVVNLSLWVGGDDPNVRNYITTLLNRGILVVVGSYNSGPGVWNCDALPLAKYPGVVAVVATDENDTHWSGCTQGIGGFLMAAPGHNILTEYALGGAIAQSGTSYAAPQVSAAASVLFSCEGNPSLDTVRSALIKGKDLGASGFDSVYGYGRLDMFSAVLATNSCVGDLDRDGFSDYVEVWLGTDSLRRCKENGWPPDFNSDRFVDITDISWIAGAFGSSTGDVRYNVRYDLNVDGVIDVSDTDLLASRFGRVCTVPALSLYTGFIRRVVPDPSLPLFAGNLVKFRGITQNGSNVTAGSFLLRFCVDNPNCLTSQTNRIGQDIGVSNLGPFEAIGADSDFWTATSGKHTATFCVNVGPAPLAESDYSYNCDSFDFTVN